MTISPAESYTRAKQGKSHPMTRKFSTIYPFELDDFQIEACHALEEESGVLVAAPTGSGKTVVGEFAIFRALEQGRKCFYTTPIKALSNQKYLDLVDIHGADRVGLLTGDTNVNSDAQILIMTTEVLRNMIYAQSPTLENLGFVVMDEVHYLADKFRGAVWEEILIHLDPEVLVVSLSATVSNVEEFGEWLATVRGRTKIVLSEERPVPLYQHVLVGHRLLDLFEAPGRINKDLLREERRAIARTQFKGRDRDSAVLDKSEIIEKLDSEGYLPCIFFIFSRNGCDLAAKRCYRDGIDLTSGYEKSLISEYVQTRTSHLPAEDLAALDFYEWASIWERGLAVHHAGLLPLFKEIIEGLFKEGLLKVVFATETLALGINMPARTVVLEKLIKWNGESHVMITPGEYTQLTGRAGRRGIDVEGNSVILWTPAIDSAMAGSLAGTRTYPLKSSFTPTYNMSANLINRLAIARVLESLALSYAQFQADRSLSGVIDQIAKNREALKAAPPSCDCGDFEEYFSIRLEIRELERGSVNERGSKRHKALEERSERIAVLRKRLREHECHRCPERDDHARIYEKRYKLERDTLALEQKVESRRNVIPRTFQRVLEVLRELGYVEGERLTEAGKGLLGIFAESDLLVAELLKGNLISTLDAADIPAVLSGLLFEARGEEKQLPRIPNSIRERVRDVVSIWIKLEEVEAKYGLSTQREPDFSMSWSVSRWSHGGTISSVLRESDLSIGDFVRHIKQIIDLLGQLISSDSTNSSKYQEALASIDRGIVRYASVAG